MAVTVAATVRVAMRVTGMRFGRGRLAPAMLRVLVLMADRREQVDEVLVVQAVEHPPAVAPDGDQAQVAEDAQLLRDRVAVRPARAASSSTASSSPMSS